MRLRWFGEPWPDASDRAGVCEDDRYRVSAPVGHRCVGCEQPIYEHERGVVMAGHSDIPGSFVLSVLDPDTREYRTSYVVAYHHLCLLREIVGPDFDMEGIA